MQVRKGVGVGPRSCHSVVGESRIRIPVSFSNFEKQHSNFLKGSFKRICGFGVLAMHLPRMQEYFADES